MHMHYYFNSIILYPHLQFPSTNTFSSINIYSVSTKVEFFLLFSNFIHFTIVLYWERNAMEYKLITKSVLHQLGIGKSYSGYDYILHAIDLIMHNENALNSVTKILYIDVAKEYHTSQTCVERNIRKVIEVIWNHADDNNSMIQKIFGDKYLSHKPSNKEFLELLYEYIKLQDTLKRALVSTQIICPISNQACTAFEEILEKLIHFD